MPTLLVPPSVNYKGALVAVPDNSLNEPKEGNKLINCEIDWGSTDVGTAGALGCVSFNLQNNATLEFSQINAVVIDNSQCGTDVTFIFTDTNVTFTIPAYTPYAIVPVYTHQTAFYVTAQALELSTDVTRFSILNYQPAPLAVPTTQHQYVGTISGISYVGASGSQLVLPTNVQGTLEALEIVISANRPSGTYTTNFALNDGTNKQLWAGTAIADSVTGGAPSAIIANLSGLNMRFQQGLNFGWTNFPSNSSTTAVVSVNAYYRTP
jgi:hypothetical protein